MNKTSFKLFFDLDGTLLDARQRLYRLFNDLTGQKIKLSFKEYWDLKREGIGHKEILTFKYDWSEKQYLEFFEQWMSKIESAAYLKNDTLLPSVKSVLEQCKKRNIHICIVTNRQNPFLTKYQLEDMNILHLVDNLLVTEQKQTKKHLIKNVYKDLKKSDYLIGDTGQDIQCANALGIQSVAVLSGFLSEKQLLKYSPRFIYEDVNVFMNNQILI